jgi:predicted AlkP superfamily phosphohydrolase/phosphomutase
LDFNTDLKTSETELIDQRNLRHHRFWDILARDGISVGSLGGVVTYPPRDIEGGFEVSGPMTPEGASVFTSPPEISEEITELCPGYEFGPDMSGSRQEIEQTLFGTIDNRATVAKHLLETRDWEFFFTLFVSTDRAQHKLWETPESIRRIYERIDTFLGWIETTYPDANVILVSDHGFTTPPERDFFVNTWLSKYRSDGDTNTTSLRYGVPKALYSKARQLTGIDFRQFLPAAVERWLTSPPSEEDVSPVRGTTGDIAGIRVGDIPNRETVIEELIAELETLTDDGTGQPVFNEVYRRKVLYHGDYMTELPEIILLPMPTHNVNANPYPSVFGAYPGMDNEGAHEASPNGLLMMDGPDIANTEGRTDAAIADIAPTILHLMGSAVPTDLDGSVIETALVDPDPDVQYRDPIPYRHQETPDRETDRSDVEERLGDLGYL